jgi:uncharacterized protein (TIGR02646 family)
MYKFRLKTPCHRSSYPSYANYSQYRSILKEDFNDRCAYCDDTEKYSKRSFAIDHFIPQTPKNFVPATKSNYYENLIYSCSYCNRAKWDKWPTDDENKPNNGTIGFVKPTSDDYDNLFFRNPQGRIIPVEGNVLAIHIKNELFLWLPVHALMWRIEKLMDLEEKVDAKLKLKDNKELMEMHNQINKQIVDVFREIFK